MRISEISPADSHPPSTDCNTHLQFISQLESSINEIESLSFQDQSSLQNLIVRLADSLPTTTSSSSPPLSNPSKIRVWKLSYRLWNACVDLSNAANALPAAADRNPLPQAELRQIAAQLLLWAKNPAGIPSPAFKSASFLHKTGLMWHDLGRLDAAAANFESAANLISSAHAESDDEKRFLLDLNLARARTAWAADDRRLAVALLGRSKTILFGSPAGFQSLAEQYLQFGKLSLKTSCEDALKLLSEALDLCEKGIAISTGGTLELELLKVRCLRFMAAERLQGGDFEGVLSCVKVLRGIEGKEEEHPSVGYVAMKACIGAGRVGEAEKELRGMMGNKRVPESACVSAAEAFLSAAGAEAGKEIARMLLGRCKGGGAAVVMRVVRMVAGSDGCGVGIKVVMDIASDDRVVGMFVGNTVVRERNDMHGLLWNWGVEHFRSKEYEISAELFEKSMLYVPQDEENRGRRSNCFRVLSLCHLALVQLDQAQEFIDQAEKLEPNIKCSFLKFKIQLQKKDEEAAINQIQAMVSCIDFNPEFLTLCAHEAISCQSFTVAVASLSILLSLHSPGKPMPMTEVTVFRNLITLLHRDSESEQEILKHTRRVRARMNELGTENFFGKGVVGARELNWFAGNTWNMGLKMGKDKKHEICAEYFELAAEFFGSLTDEDERKKEMVCKSLILSTGAMLHAEEEKKVSMTDSDVKKAIEMLQRADKMLPSLPLSGAITGDQLDEAATSICFLHTFNSYQLLNRVDDTRNQQLQLIKKFASTKACNPNYLLQIGLFASQGRKPNPEVSEFAFSKCLSTLLDFPAPDYQMVSMVLRRLVGIAALSGMDDGRQNEAVYTVYRQAYQIIVGLKEGEYPAEEGKWLAMTAWNRSATAVRLRHVGTARKWMKMGLDLAKGIPSMEKYVGGMEDCFANFEKVCNGSACGAEYAQNDISPQPLS